MKLKLLSMVTEMGVRKTAKGIPGKLEILRAFINL
jgi:hypothetical protein